MSEAQTSLGTPAQPPDLFLSRRPTVLVADVPDKIAEIECLLDGIAAIVSASTLTEALAYLRHGVDLVAVGLHFEESRALELLRSARLETLQCTVPFVCYCALDEFAQSANPEVEVALKALDAKFVDLARLRQQRGTGRANAAFVELPEMHWKRERRSVKHPVEREPKERVFLGEPDRA